MEMKNEASVVVVSADDEENAAVSETRYLSPEKEYPSWERYSLSAAGQQHQTTMLVLE